MFGFGSKPDHFNDLMEYLVEHWHMRSRFAAAFLSAYRKDVSSTLEEGIKRTRAMNIPSVAMLAMGDDPRAMALVAQAYKGYLSDLRRGKHVRTDVEMAIWGILANRSDLVASVDRGFASFIDDNWEKQYPALFETVFTVEA